MPKSHKKSNKQNKELTSQNELDLLLRLIPERIKIEINKHNPLDLIEIVMDLGRRPELRFRDLPPLKLNIAVTQSEIDFITNNLAGFTSENRAGIEETLHRISAIRNQKGKIIGLTCRVGRTLQGTIQLEKEFLNTYQSVLLLGPPGSGKTSKLREIAHLYAEEYEKRVIIVDTSMEIAGAGDIPHPSIGRARRMPVIDPSRQHEVMIEAVENHMPEIIIIDEIGTEEEAKAAQTIAERGVILIATAHGRDLESVVKNPSLNRLVGEPETVTLSDEEAKKRRTQKNILERKHSAYFQSVVEIISFNSILVHTHVDSSVDKILKNEQCNAEFRQKKLSQEQLNNSIELKIYPYAISHTLVEDVIKEHNFNARVVLEIEESNLIVCLDDYGDDTSNVFKLARDNNILLKTISDNKDDILHYALESAQIILNRRHNRDNQEYLDEIEMTIALEEVEKAIRIYKTKKQEIALTARTKSIRVLQFDLLQKHDIQFEVRTNDDFQKEIILLG